MEISRIAYQHEKDRTKTINRILFLFLFFMCLLTAFFSGIYTSEKLNDTGSRINKANKNISSDISNFSEKLNEEVQSFFVYNISNINKSLTIDQLKEQGGVCLHYANYYIDRTLNDTGFYAQKISFKINDTTKHAIAVISGDKGYCILDQTERWCAEFG